MASAIRDDNPVVYLIHYLLVLEHGDVPEGEYLVPIGEAAIRRAGSDVTIVATGWTVGKALAAAETLAGEGIDAEVIDPRTLQPLDMPAILASVEKTGRLVLADQATRHASAASIIAAEVAEHGFGSLKAPIKLVTALDATIPYSEPMEAFVLPDEHKIAGAVREVLAPRRWPPDVARRGPRRPVRRRPRSTPTALDLLRTMWRIRCFEERVAKLHRSLQVHGLIHLSIGSEGVAAGVCGQLRDDDAVYSGHRAHGHALAKGAPMDRDDGRADGPLGRAVPRAGRLDAPGRHRARPDGRHRRRRAATCRWPPATRWRRGCAGSDRGHGGVLRRRRRPGRPLHTRPSTWPRCGSCR